jgi:hypothetical protein
MPIPASFLVQWDRSGVFLAYYRQGLNTELEVAIATLRIITIPATVYRYSIQIQSMLRTQHGTATNNYCDACLCAACLASLWK